MKLFANTETARDKKSGWLLYQAQLQKAPRVFLIALRISKAALKFYNFDSVDLKKVSSSTFLFYHSVWSSAHFLCADVCKVGWKGAL